MFPEGTRHDKNELMPFKKGSFHLSVQSEMRLLPVIVQKYPFIDHREKVFGRGEVKVKILLPIEKLENESVEELTQRVYNIMNTEFKSLNEM